MARRLLGLLCLSAFATGCATQGSRTAGLPRPTFDGPTIAKLPTPVAPPPVVAMIPKSPLRPLPPQAGIPAAWVPLPNAEKRLWTYIVIHHSATPTGGAAAFDKAHKAKGWDGVGYDFVIGNGSDTKDGQVEVGYRWPIQAQGAHAYTPDERYNMHGIGICLVGNMMDHAPTARQSAALNKLVAYLADAYKIKQSNIIGHKMTGKQTDCPGSLTNIAQIRNDVARLRRMTVTEDDLRPTASGGELIETAAAH